MAVWGPAVLPAIDVTGRGFVVIDVYAAVYLVNGCKHVVWVSPYVGGDLVIDRLMIAQFIAIDMNACAALFILRDGYV